MSFLSGRTDKKQNKGTAQRRSSLHSRTCWETPIQIPTRSVHKTFQASGHESSSRCAFHISILPTRSHTCLVDRTERINNRSDGDLQSLWPASSENVLVNLLLLHCGHCLWDWTFPHSSRKQQTNVCTRQHLKTILGVKSYSVFTAPPSTHICLKCAYVFTPPVGYNGSLSTVNETCNKTKDTVQ